MDAVSLSLATRNPLLPIFLKNLILAGWCCPDLHVEVFFTMLDLLHGSCALCEVTVLLRGWHKALRTFQGYVLHH